MATLSRIIGNICGEALAQRGYQRETSRFGLIRYRAEGSSLRIIEFNVLKTGGHLRVLMDVCFAGSSQPACSDISGESPWWEYESDSTKVEAVSSALDFLSICGFAWLENPMSLTPTEWRVQFHLLAWDHRNADVTVELPPLLSLNERVMLVKNAIPTLSKVAALELRRQLEGLKSLSLGVMPFANAMELKALAESKGLPVSVRRSR